MPPDGNRHTTYGAVLPEVEPDPDQASASNHLFTRNTGNKRARQTIPQGIHSPKCRLENYRTNDTVSSTKLQGKKKKKRWIKRDLRWTYMILM